MTDERFKKVAAIFDQAVQIPPASRQAFVEEQAAGDPHLRTAVEALLARDANMPAYLRESVIADGASQRAAEVLGDPAAAAPRPPRLDRYDLLDVIGQGGMGVVYRARQHTPNRIVAVKVLRSGVAGPHVLRRFEFEVNALGKLQHPNIAQIHEAGVAGSGDRVCPFLVMEYIEGKPLDRYIRANAASIEDRLRLFIRMCRAVDHAHQNGIVHRDLKPANVLVTTSNEPKILDFGVARALRADSRTTRTRAGQLIGTPQYMSPEQVEGDPASLGVGVDIYALGLILFEMLEGRVPFPMDTRDAEQSIRQISEPRSAPTTTVQRRFKSDLDRIIARCLEHDPNRRYPSAEALAVDLERFLADRPVAARPATVMYRASKFMARHRLAVAIAASLALVAGIGLSLAPLLRRGEVGDPGAQPTNVAPPSTSIEEQVREWLALRPVEAMETVPDLIHAGAAAEAIRSANAAMTGALPGRETSRVRSLLAIAYFHTGEYTKAEAELRMMVGRSDPEAPLAPGQLPQVLGTTLLGWAALLQGRAQESKSILARVAGMDRVPTMPGVEDLRLLAFDAQVGMGLADVRLGNAAAAKPRLESATAALEQMIKNPRHPSLVRAFSAMAELNEALGNSSEAATWRQRVPG